MAQTPHDRLLALAEELGELAETLHDPTFSTVLAAAEEARAIAAELEPRETAQAYEPLPVDSYPHGGF